MPELPDLAAVRRYGELIFAAMPDVEWHAGEMWALGDMVFTLWRGEGTHLGEWAGIPATGKRLTWRGLMTSRIRDGKLVEEMFEFDSMSIYRQMGALPALQEATA